LQSAQAAASFPHGGITASIAREVVQYEDSSLSSISYASGEAEPFCSANQFEHKITHRGLDRSSPSSYDNDPADDFRGVICQFTLVQLNCVDEPLDCWGTRAKALDY